MHGNPRGLLKGGIPAVMFENMYDFPHTERLDALRREQCRNLLVAFKAPEVHPEEHRLRAPWETLVDPARVRTFMDSVMRSRRAS